MLHPPSWPAYDVLHTEKHNACVLVIGENLPSDLQVCFSNVRLNRNAGAPLKFRIPALSHILGYQNVDLRNFSQSLGIQVPVRYLRGDNTIIDAVDYNNASSFVYTTGK